MSLTEEQISDLERIKADGGCHASNILAKKHHDNIGDFVEEYFTFSKSFNLSLGKSVKALNKYKDFVDNNNPYTPQSKFAPTILEEFFCRILKKKFGNDVLNYGPIKAYSSLYFSYSDLSSFKDGIEIKLNVKDQDVGIYKKETFKTSIGGEQVISIPIVCIECKTYLDKTMYEGCVSTATKIKTGNPNCLYFIVTETYDVSKDVDIETTSIDNIYVLRKQRRKIGQKSNKIYKSVIQHLLNSIKTNLNSSTRSVDDCITSLGYIRQ